MAEAYSKKEDLLVNTIDEQNCDICSVSECDIEDFDDSKPFSIKGFKTLFPLQRPGSSTKRVLCFINEEIDVTQRNDLMSNLLSTIWFEINGTNQKILICVIYREFSDLTGMGQMSIDQQIERWRIFKSQVEHAKNEGLILRIGDMNINLEKIEDSNYYLKPLAEEYHTLINENSLKIFNFGITWSRIHKHNKTKESAVDHAFTNKMGLVHNHFKIHTDYSDHSMICVDLNTKVSKPINKSKVTRDFRKLRSNPQYFLYRLAKVEWESFVRMRDV